MLSFSVMHFGSLMLVMPLLDAVAAPGWQTPAALAAVAGAVAFLLLGPLWRRWRRAGTDRRAKACGSADGGGCGCAVVKPVLSKRG